MINGDPKHRTREGFIITDGKLITLALLSFDFQAEEGPGRSPIT